jgi:hypothetical protein
MSLPNLSKKKKEETTYADLDINESNSTIKVVPCDDRKYKLIKGNSGYETIQIKRGLTEGCYCIGLDDITKENKKHNPKACFRFGVFCQTEEVDLAPKTNYYCLGSCKNSISLRSSDLAILHNGSTSLRTTTSLPPSETKVSVSETESMLSGRIKNELLHDYYLVLCLKNPKNPEMIKYYKDKLPSEELAHSPDSFIAFFKGQTLMAKISNLREGTYSIGVSMYMEAAVMLDIMPNMAAFKQEVTNSVLDSPEIVENLFDSKYVSYGKKIAQDIVSMSFSKLAESQE